MLFQAGFLIRTILSVLEVGNAEYGAYVSITIEPDMLTEETNLKLAPKEVAKPLRPSLQIPGSLTPAL